MLQPQKITMSALATYFYKHPYGLALRNPTLRPPLDAFEAQAWDLKADQDIWRYRAGDLAVLLAKCYGLLAYEKIAGMTNLAAPETIERWASICRRVPLEVRNGLSISFAEAVAPIGDPIDQRELLAYAKEKGLHLRQFEEHVTLWRGLPTQPAPQGREDKIYELEREAHDLEVKYQEERVARVRAEARADRAEGTMAQLRGRVEALLGMKPTELMVNISQVVQVLKEVLEALGKLGVDN